MSRQGLLEGSVFTDVAVFHLDYKTDPGFLAKLSLYICNLQSVPLIKHLIPKSFLEITILSNYSMFIPTLCHSKVLVNSFSFEHNFASQLALVVKNSPANAGDKRDSGSIPGWGGSPGGGQGNPL